MKKMLVAMAAAALCGAALADTFGYTYFSNYASVDPNPSDVSGAAYYSCYLINSETVSSAAGLETWLTENGGITRENIASKGSAITSYQSLAWNGSQYALQMNKNETALTTESDYKYAVILAATEKTSEAPDFAYEIMQGTSQFDISSGTTWNFNDTNEGAVTWTTAPVPEPTSGLLLLLGVAGLALKRKRT